MSIESTPVTGLELNIRAVNIIRSWNPIATLGDLRTAIAADDQSLLKLLRVRDRKEIAELLNNIKEPKGLFDHITAEAVFAERERTGDGLQTCKQKMQRSAVVDHLQNAEHIDVRAVLLWLAGGGA